MSGSLRMYTENSGPTYSSSGDPRVDFFFHITEDATEDRTLDLLIKSWECHPLDTLKLIAFLRDCRNGKGIRRQYQMTLFWVFNNHFQTLVENLKELTEFGYYKDLLHLLIIILFDGHIPHYLSRDDGRKVNESQPKKIFPVYDRIVLKWNHKEKQKKKKEYRDAINSGELSDLEIENLYYKLLGGQLTTVNPKRSEVFEKSRKTFAQNRYNSDNNYSTLFDAIVEIFAQQLNEDLAKMAKKNKSISLAGKWAPTNRHHFDKYLFISEQIGRKICEIQNQTEIMNDSKLVSKFYQSEVCSPLRHYLKVPEVFMSAQLWSQIEYNRVASKCMQKNKSLFIKHDSQRFQTFLESKKTIAGAVLKPVELVERGLKFIEKSYFMIDGDYEQNQGLLNVDQDNLEIEVLEKQWLSLTEDIQKKGGGLLENAIAVCDVSGSMYGTPMSAAIGLTILVMSLSSEPWNSLCITFHESPQFHVVEPEKRFLAKLKSLKEMSWGGTTNLNKVFDLILSKASEQRLTEQQMPKLLLIFTDMEFNSAFPGTSLTNYEAAKVQFESAGYKLPSVVFWNLRASTASTPVQINEYGAALMAGYSGQQLALILKTEDIEKMNAYSLMRSAIDHKRYSKLKIVD